jgi:crotonobetainyl-CoA:carnitine CoA-transferase CaiB-like acyl-CoA transferase
MTSVIALLNKSEIACSPINSIADIFQDPQFAARKTLLNAEHPLLGKIAMPAIVPRISETAGKIEWLGRDLGADTDAVLARTLNYSLARLAELRDRGVI